MTLEEMQTIGEFLHNGTELVMYSGFICTIEEGRLIDVDTKEDMGDIMQWYLEIVIIRNGKLTIWEDLENGKTNNNII